MQDRSPVVCHSAVKRHALASHCSPRLILPQTRVDASSPVRSMSAPDDIVACTPAGVGTCKAASKFVAPNAIAMLTKVGVRGGGRWAIGSVSAAVTRRQRSASCCAHCKPVLDVSGVPSYQRVRIIRCDACLVSADHGQCTTRSTDVCIMIRAGSLYGLGLLKYGIYGIFVYYTR